MIARILVAAVCILVAAPALCEMQLYDVQAEYRQEVYEVLKGILRSDADPIENPHEYGQVKMLPNGQILIDAAADKQVEIAALLSKIASRSAPETPTISRAPRLCAVFSIAWTRALPIPLCCGP